MTTTHKTTDELIDLLALPYLGSWCALDVCEDGGAMRQRTIRAR